MTSHRQIFRSSTIIGGASIINILVGIIKTKVIAVLLGPAGVGLMGLYQSIMSTVQTLAGCGMDTSGVRQIAVSNGDNKVLDLVRRSLLWGNLLLGGIGIVILLLARKQVSQLVFNDTEHVVEIGLLGVGVFFSLMAASQMALLQGLRRIGDIARVNIFSSVAGLIIGVLIIWWQRQDGVHWFVITAPMTSFIFASWYASRLQRVEVEHDRNTIIQEWQSLLRLGIPVMAAALLTLVTQLLARTFVLNELGLDASGYFQAAWAISMTYIGFVLGAMATDYLPRLTEAINEPERANRLVNEQMEMGLLMAAPVLLAMLTLSPWLIELLYAKSFAPAAEILRWQVMGDVFKVLGWPMGFIILALGRGDVFIATQLNWNVIYLLCLWFGVGEMGLLVVGVGFFVAYVFQVGLVRLVVGGLTGFSSQTRNFVLFLLLVISASAVLILTYQWELLSLILGGLLTLCFALYSAWRFNDLFDLKASLAAFVGRFGLSAQRDDA